MMSPGLVSSPVIVSFVWSRSTSFASPKSSTFARPSRVMRMFAGLMSRWTMPLPCAALSAEAICAAYSSALATGSGPAAIKVSSRVPSTSSIAMNVVPLSSSISWIVTMFGWLRAEAARASWMKRRWRSGSAVASGGSILIATARPSRVSCAE